MSHQNYYCRTNITPIVIPRKASQISNKSQLSYRELTASARKETKTKSQYIASVNYSKKQCKTLSTTEESWKSNTRTSTKSRPEENIEESLDILRKLKGKKDFSLQFKIEDIINEMSLVLKEQFEIKKTQSSINSEKEEKLRTIKQTYQLIQRQQETIKSLSRLCLRYSGYIQ